jgi:hypothetical protein
MSLITQREASTIIAIDSVIRNDVSLFLAALHLFRALCKQISHFNFSFHVKNTFASYRYPVT